MIIDGNKLTADEGFWLTNGEVYVKELVLGINDRAENWTEVDELPPEPEPEELENN